MSSLLDSLTQFIGPQQVSAMAQQIGASPEQTEQAIGLALPTLLAALAKHTEHEEGAAQLHQALDTEQHHSPLDNLGSLLGGSLGGSAAGGAGGGGLGGLLGSILGARQGKVEQGIGKASGLSAGQITSLLAMLGPLVMGFLSRMKREQPAGSGDVASSLRKERTQMQNQAGGGLLAGMLDQDGDGDFDFSDMVKLGMKSLFKRK